MKWRCQGLVSTENEHPPLAYRYGFKWDGDDNFHNERGSLNANYVWARAFRTSYFHYGVSSFQNDRLLVVRIELSNTYTLNRFSRFHLFFLYELIVKVNYHQHSIIPKRKWAMLQLRHALFQGLNGIFIDFHSRQSFQKCPRYLCVNYSSWSVLQPAPKTNCLLNIFETFIGDLNLTVQINVEDAVRCIYYVYKCLMRVRCEEKPLSRQFSFFLFLPNKRFSC